MDQTTGIAKSTTVGAAPTPVRAENGQSIEQIRQNIEKTRSEITDTVDQLGDKLKETFDWRTRVAEYPLAAVGGAALIGFLVARKLMAPKRSNTEELLQNLIKTGINAFQPKRQGLFVTLLTLGGKYAFDRFQQYQQEQAEQQRYQQQLAEYQAMLMQQQDQIDPQEQIDQQTGNRNVGQHRVAGSDF